MNVCMFNVCKLDLSQLGRYIRIDYTDYEARLHIKGFIFTASINSTLITKNSTDGISCHCFISTSKKNSPFSSTRLLVARKHVSLLL